MSEINERFELTNGQESPSEQVGMNFTGMFDWTDQDGFVIFQPPQDLDSYTSSREKCPETCVDGSTLAIFQSGASKIVTILNKLTQKDPALQMTANALVFLHFSMPCDVFNIVVDGSSERFSKFYQREVESRLYNFYIRKVHTIWGVIGSKENCNLIWNWHSSYLSSPPQPHPMRMVVYGMLALAASYKGDEIWEEHYFHLARSEIPATDLLFENFIALSLLVMKSPTSPSLMLIYGLGDHSRSQMCQRYVFSLIRKTVSEGLS